MPEGLGYSGAAVPGLAARPAWSLPPADAIALGEALLFVEDAPGEHALGHGYAWEPVVGPVGTLHVTDEPESATLEFRGVQAGEVRTTLKATTGPCGWSPPPGTTVFPAVAVCARATTESDGLSEEKTTPTVTVYGSGGGVLGCCIHVFHQHLDTAGWAAMGVVGADAIAVSRSPRGPAGPPSGSDDGAVVLSGTRTVAGHGSAVRAVQWVSPTRGGAAR
ncbi:hypothetical protein [Streptomyces sp. SP18CS02]|uniref:hypothetical protein n=1 Tax=Streptomyces sp. SP18CS02 TaxID=3002531 RepID=UPI002E79B8BF|nr:hypothetical protein [Streptomyces sp. SP18CS02]MEE1753122.1 hypothetical protein [Streptomyces sp. SP18CS02]